MAEREQKKKPAPQREDEVVDDVLEQNAEDFVKSYIQKGGQ